MSIVEELRSKASRDNRDLLDRAAKEIEVLQKDIQRLQKHVGSLEKSRDAWKEKTERLSKQSEGIANNATTTGEWIEIPIDNYDGDPSGLYYVCSVCHTDNGFEDKPYCPNCGAKMKQN